MVSDAPTALSEQEQEFDVLVIGAGFSGLHQLIKLRDAGFSVKVFEAGSNIGGTWHWNCYPGARVDSDFSIYQLSFPEIWKDWTWKERFPGREELVEYFDHIDKTFDVKRSISFGTRVTAAQFDASTDRWVVSTQGGNTVRPRFLDLCTGFASKALFPDFKGLSTFEGIVHHTALWPQDGVDLAGKRIGVIGTGASGVQVIQEVGPIAKHLTVFQRTPCFALAMRQRKLSPEEQDELKAEVYPVIFRRCRQTEFGLHYNGFKRGIFDLTPEERYLTFDELWKRGGFSYTVGNGSDLLSSQKANEEVYKFWRKKVLARVQDPEMQRKLAPEKQPYPLGAKRSPLEQKYYEVFNQPNVNLIDIQENSIVEVTRKGVKTSDGVEHEFDILVLATGFDAITGSISQIGIEGTDGTLIGDKWKNGVGTYLGLTSAGYPNMFFPYGPHGPTALCNGPTCLEVQCDWIFDCISYLRSHNYTRIEPTQAAETTWTELVHSIYSMQLFKHAKSWYNGANVPGKRVETLNFTGGLQLYIQMCKESADGGYVGFTLSPPNDSTGSSAIAEDTATTGIENGQSAPGHGRRASGSGVLGWFKSVGSRRRPEVQ